MLNIQFYIKYQIANIKMQIFQEPQALYVAPNGAINIVFFDISRNISLLTELESCIF